VWLIRRRRRSVARERAGRIRDENFSGFSSFPTSLSHDLTTACFDVSHLSPASSSSLATATPSLPPPCFVESSPRTSRFPSPLPPFPSILAHFRITSTSDDFKSPHKPSSTPITPFPASPTLSHRLLRSPNPHLPLISLNSPVLSPPPASMSDTQSTLEGPCAVCGTATKHRCSSCAEHGFDLFLCGREHQKLVSFSSFLSFMRTRTSSPRSSADLVRS
jgi:hypothetical protein